MPFPRKLLYSVAAAATLVHGTANAAWPERPVRIVVPYAPGGFTDVLARLVGTKLAEKLGQPVVVDNKPGASTMLGAEAVARAPADGYTLLMATTSTLSTNPLMFRKMPYKTADFVPVALAGLTPFVLVAHPSVPVKDAAGLVSYARGNPGRLNFAMLGPGSSTHLVDEMLRSAAKVDIPDVPYKGSGPASNDLLAGHVQLNFDAVSTAIPRIRSGQLKGLGITSDTRSPLLPNVPTFKESGLPQMVAYSWYGLMAPAGTPAAVVEQLNRSVNEVLRLPEIQAQLDANGANAPALDPRQFGALIAEHTHTWERIVKPMNLQLD
ncbi:Bug family tripartite tricarboxylate transporter substrate binding protein [Ramlibacter sp. AN1133]|uniref:Bug family tripartite tricarboxylate transporter substrate binding protein n=1 Tax=Ramlibacter sp. AN1133 TaxID=3133429 RepID=UPI0030C14584